MMSYITLKSRVFHTAGIERDLKEYVKENPCLENDDGHFRIKLKK